MDGTVGSSYLFISNITLGATHNDINYNFTNFVVPVT
jgi:hypothetical protein